MHSCVVLEWVRNDISMTLVRSCDAERLVSGNSLGEKLFTVVMSSASVSWDFMFGYSQSHVSISSLTVFLSPGTYLRPGFTAQLVDGTSRSYSAVVLRREVLWLSPVQSLPYGHFEWWPTSDTGVGLVLHGKLCGNMSPEHSQVCTPLHSRFYAQSLQDVATVSSSLTHSALKSYFAPCPCNGVFYAGEGPFHSGKRASVLDLAQAHPFSVGFWCDSATLWL
jgi:hypothetical protein